MERRLIESNIYDRLPDGLKPITELFEGRERDIVLFSSFTVLSNCFPKVTGFYDGNVVYPHLYTIIIAPPASGKGVMNYARALINPIHETILNGSLHEYRSCVEKLKANQSDKHCPPIRVKILPADISTAELYSYLASSSDGVLMMESEADTLTKMFGNDWSNYSDLLRKCSHHETISKARKEEKTFIEVKEPKLALLLSGTPGQLQKLICSKENGLFSRTIIYNYDEISSEFKDVFAPQRADIRLAFGNLGNKILESYNRLFRFTEPIIFEFTESQKKKFLKMFGFIKKDIIANHSQGFVSNLHRGALNAYKIAMILTILRNIDEINENTRELTCSNVDFLIAMSITKTVLRHAQYTFDTLENGIPTQDVEMLSELSEIFTTAQAIEVGRRFNIEERTVHDKLKQWIKKKIIVRYKRGFYKQL